MDRMCNECGEVYPDDGDPECPFCGSDDTFVVPDDVEFEGEDKDEIGIK